MSGLQNNLVPLSCNSFFDSMELILQLFRNCYKQNQRKICFTFVFCYLVFYGYLNICEIFLEYSMALMLLIDLLIYKCTDFLRYQFCTRNKAIIFLCKLQLICYAYVKLLGVNLFLATSYNFISVAVHSLH